MFYTLATLAMCFQIMHSTVGRSCENNCPPEDNEMVCGFGAGSSQYKMFPSKCALDGYNDCHEVDFIETPLKFCIKEQKFSRRVYGESCPVFCPTHYRPVCGASKLRSYIYKTFTNSCYLDMVNCRGDEVTSGYVEVPLDFCQRHLMKNIFKEQVVISNLQNF